jgi:hypothetical protein
MTQPTDVLVSLTNGAYNNGTRAINLRIEDESTGKFIINVDMDGESFAQFVTTSGIQVDGLELCLVVSPNRPFVARLDIIGPQSQFWCTLRGEQFAAVLGNAVTRISGAHILKEF